MCSSDLFAPATPAPPLYVFSHRPLSPPFNPSVSPAVPLAMAPSSVPARRFAAAVALLAALTSLAAVAAAASAGATDGRPAAGTSRKLTYRPTPTCPPYTVCGGGRPPCGGGRTCAYADCTSSACGLDPRTCAPTVCTADCLANAGTCGCPPYQVCGLGRPACGAGRRCNLRPCTASSCAVDPATCLPTGLCTKDCQRHRGYCVPA